MRPSDFDIDVCLARIEAQEAEGEREQEFLDKIQELARDGEKEIDRLRGIALGWMVGFFVEAAIIIGLVARMLRVE